MANCNCHSSRACHHIGFYNSVPAFVIVIIIICYVGFGDRARG